MRRILFTLLALSCCFGGVLAEKIERDTLHVEMHAVSVVAVRERTIVKPQVLTDSVLQRLNSQSVADALRYFTGVQVKDYGGIGGIKTVNIRSMGTNHVGVFYNGVQLGNAQNGQVDLGRYSLDNVESISLYNGQKSDIFQTAKDFSASMPYMSQPDARDLPAENATMWLRRCAPAVSGWQTLRFFGNRSLAAAHICRQVRSIRMPTDVTNSAIRE